MKKLFRIISLITCLCLLASGSALAAGYSSARLKDVAKVQGVRANQLMGYGLVVGLNGTGDSDKMKQTIQSIGNMMKDFGVVIDTNGLKPKNVAAVIVTATLPPFVREGDTIDITVSSMGCQEHSGGNPFADASEGRQRQHLCCCHGGSVHRRLYGRQGQQQCPEEFPHCGNYSEWCHRRAFRGG